MGIDGQYRAVREESGYARRERSVIAVSGADAAEYLQGQLTNDIEALVPAEGCYGALLDRKGRMQADMDVLRLDEGVLLLLEPIALDAALRHLTMYSVGRDVAVEDRSAETAVIALVGPATFDRTGLAPLGAELAHAGALVGGAEARAVRTAEGVDLVIAADAAAAVTAELGRMGVAPVGDEALEIVRVENGRPRFGREMTTATIPQEAGINERAVSFTKGCYIGQETVARLHYKGKPNRHLRGLKLGEPAADDSVVVVGEKEVGRLGTAVLSPARGPLALAILRREAEPGTTVEVDGSIEATVVDLPFA